MLADAQGNAMTATSSTSVDAYDRAIDHLLHFRPEVSPTVESLILEDASCVMGQVAAAYLGMLGTEARDTALARSALSEFEASVDSGAVLARERMHLAAAHALVHGDLSSGGSLLREIAREHPRDALALAVGHQVDFFTGDAGALRDRVGGALSAWTPDDPHYGPLLGMYAFGLEEAGHYGRALEVGLESVERDPADVWGIHAVTHTYEMQGRISEGLRYLDEHSDAWEQGNYLNVHNSWHYSLFLLDAGHVNKALTIYDAVLHNAHSAGLAMEMLDAAALLWRMYLDGEDQSARWRVLAEAWDPAVREPFYAFNDMHAVMSYIGAGRIADAELLVQSRETYVTESRDSSVTNVAMTRDLGLPVMRALVAFGRAEYREVVNLLLPVRHALHRMGGSHAQRDAVQRTLLEASLRSGRHATARMLLSERMWVNPCSPYGWLRQAALSRAIGDALAAAIATERADELRRAPTAT